ncbi:hypothetical protein K466DRAFT_236040 [Polyporus arcularius HHB13444]|uniref:Uncharacterized protein n=1 Tax=Polyporus arcularius HHB13444 TaxID=1314778 RepID=A0A5C3P7A2_9APHY|nr:hypothetical protein K466DRAFT_236040 [Polyporus arcularius HHB13444]
MFSLRRCRFAFTICIQASKPLRLRSLMCHATSTLSSTPCISPHISLPFHGTLGHRSHPSYCITIVLHPTSLPRMQHTNAHMPFVCSLSIVSDPKFIIP